MVETVIQRVVHDFCRLLDIVLLFVSDRHYFYACPFSTTVANSAWLPSGRSRRARHSRLAPLHRRQRRPPRRLVRMRHSRLATPMLQRTRHRCSARSVPTRSPRLLRLQDLEQRIQAKRTTTSTTTMSTLRTLRRLRFQTKEAPSGRRQGDHSWLHSAQLEEK